MQLISYIISVILIAIPVIILLSVLCAFVILKHKTLVLCEDTPADYGLPFTPFSCEGEHGAVLAGWYIPARNQRAVIIASHGIADSKNGILSYLLPYLNRDFSLVVYDMRHHNESTGKHCTLGYWEHKDLIRLTAYVKETFANDAPLCYWGFSLGASISLIAAAVVPDVSAVIAQSPFVSIHQVVRHYITRFYYLPPWPFVPLALLIADWISGARSAEINVCRVAGLLRHIPLLLIGSSNDRQVPLQWLEALQRVIGNSADLLVGPYGHMDIGRNAETYEPERQEIIHSAAFLINSIETDSLC